ncbi:MAG: ferrous iron transporter B [Bacillales bacterium]|nr:ferrous iron transporter B [Bacillales bacterium]
MKRFALAGNPNSGKTTLFNSLTGSSAYVGNWPGVTVEKKEGTYKKLSEEISIIDLPGIYSLSPYTSEEVVARNYIIDEKPDCIINIVDATNLERNLYLTTQIMEIDVPMVIALNMMDVVRKSGDHIEIEKLEKIIGLRVIEISALKEENLNNLMIAAFEESKKERKGITVLEDSNLVHLIHDCEIAFHAIKVNNPLFHAVKLVELDELEIKNHPELINIVNDFKSTFKDDVFGSDFEAIVADSRYKYITKYFSPYFIKNKAFNEKEENRSSKIDKVLTNKWVGIPIFLLILFLIFHLTFSSNLFYLGGLFKNVSPSFEGTMFEGLFYTSSGINSPGIILYNLIDSLTSAFSSLASGWLSSSPEWVGGLIVDGVLGGLSAVLSFVPQILCLFFFFSILEDSGYMARIAFILDKLFRKFGLSGRAFMPMIMGFGCSVPAMINTRTLADDNERIATIRVIPFFSCGAKLPILTAISGGIVLRFGIGNAEVITYSMYLLGMVTAVLSVLLMKKTTMRGEVPPFIMELPTYHLPQPRALLIHLWDKLKNFIKKAFTIILASTIVIWFISHFSFDWKYLTDSEMESSILAGIGMLIEPLFTPLGFGSQLESFGWVFVVAAFTGLVAKENVVATIGTLAASIVSGFAGSDTMEGVDSVVEMINATGITLPALLSFIAFNMLTIPCFASVATAKAELPKGKFATTLLFWISVSYIVSSMIYLIGTWWWTSFIFALSILVLILSISLYNRSRDRKKGLKK